MAHRAASFATFLIIGPTCFFLGILFIMLPYDYHVLWSGPPGMDRTPYFDLQEAHLKILHHSPPLIGRILNIAMGTGLLGFLTKLWRASEANMLFDGASLVLYMCGIIVYLTNIVKGLRTVTGAAFGPSSASSDHRDGMPHASLGEHADLLSREDSLRVMAASNTILALVLVGVLVLQAGQWYAQRKEQEEIEQMRRSRAEEAPSAKSKPSHVKKKAS